ncbi:hypothetical protein BDV98DRAFT_169947 [Pterulicium gracile]|uniref:Uncharacterized protein n=1 Tax=Pterulicium gracile TaxID=1884261 RepID=A0A5C3QG78_9AGAR|nr:hypothetical protein BDV98DRAFT_169947 [Pterula gracilis]
MTDSKSSPIAMPTTKAPPLLHYTGKFDMYHTGLKFLSDVYLPPNIAQPNTPPCTRRSSHTRPSRTSHSASPSARTPTAQLAFSCTTGSRGTPCRTSWWMTLSLSAQSPRTQPQSFSHRSKPLAQMRDWSPSKTVSLARWSWTGTAPA